MKKCKCKLRIVKPEYKTILSSPLLSKPIHLGRITEDEIEFFYNIFPEAFKTVCTCTPKSDKGETLIHLN